ncbi:molybdate ABC transporter substrate-binding protein [Alteromonas sp. MB-3u-76]|uniref:molybdate ABC transporter substrate-binding protein n=1 Tax=Alteromonas sp. MB-3u-76 TaxID=2058133 RepID=UPI000C304494|nr:molybdate ABC transporter substrate-binding protein [Alteromonas sp. MB-3u-76]AUC88621.1 molybdate ABC transporter substrate-binding protein [Alteromonas sp. MB-3u-76]
MKYFNIHLIGILLLQVMLIAPSTNAAALAQNKAAANARRNMEKSTENGTEKGTENSLSNDKHSLSTTDLLNTLRMRFSESPPLKIAVAANFSEPLHALTSSFTELTGIQVSITTSSSGTLYAQMLHGAGFDIFMSADSARPAALAENEKVHINNVVNYAQGRLALVSSVLSAENKAFNAAAIQLILDKPNEKLAIANPKLAPYGVAAKQVLQSLSLYSAIEGRLVKGKNVLQTYQYLSSGNVSHALVAYSTVLSQHGGLEQELLNQKPQKQELLKQGRQLQHGDFSKQPTGEAGKGSNNAGNWVLIDKSLHEPIIQSLVINSKKAASLSPNLFDNEAVYNTPFNYKNAKSESRENNVSRKDSIAHVDHVDLEQVMLAKLTTASVFVQYLMSSNVQMSLKHWGYEPAINAKNKSFSETAVYINKANEANCANGANGANAWSM